TCGEEHDEWPPDRAFGLPYEIYALSADERAARAKTSDDFCVLDEDRWFIRTVLSIPLRGRADRWGVGLWVEISEADCGRYYRLFNVDASREPGFPGRIANAVATFDDSLGASVHVQLGPASKRPTLIFDAQDSCSLAVAQREGLTDAAVHAALA